MSSVLFQALSSKQALLDLLNSVDYSALPSPKTASKYGNPNPRAVKSRYDCWLTWNKDHQTWEKLGDVPGGLVCLDVETTNATRSLAIASCVDMLTGVLYAWFSDPSNYDCETQKLLTLEPGTLMVAHRSTFEASFIESNFQAEHPGFKGLCTYAIAAASRHPGKMGFYRASPYLPQFKRSSDCSLASLYKLATGEHMDKSAVDVFIEGKDFSWAKDQADLLMSQGIYEAYLLGKAGSKFKKKMLPEELAGRVIWKYPKLTKTGIKRVDPHFFMIPHGLLSHEDKLLKSIIQPEFFYESPKLSANEYREKLKSHLGMEDPIGSAFAYNIFDTLATIDVIRFLISDIEAIDETTLLGMIERSTPMFAVDPTFSEQLDIIEDKFQTTSAELDAEAEQWVRDHLSVSGDWDGQNWTKNSDKCGEAKRGLPAWFDLKKLGFSKSLTAIALRASYNGNYLKRFKTTAPLKNENGSFFFRHDEKLRPRGLFALVEPIEGLSYEETMAQATLENSIPWEHPFSTDTKGFKGVGSLMSASLFPCWDEGQLTCGINVKDSIKKFMTLSYWRSTRKRLFNLKVVKRGNYFVAPRTHVNGTVTGRSVDPVFLVLAKHDKDKIGSELQGFFCAPAGYKIIQFDLDSAQARFAALFSDVFLARKRKEMRVQLVSTPFSKRIYKGSKKELSTVAHQLGRVAGYDYATEESIAKGYAKGKNAQFSLIFWVGAFKLAKMLNVALTISMAMVLSFKGELNKKTGLYESGEASDLFNCQLAMTRAEQPNGDGTWSVDRKLRMRSAVLGRPLPFVLSPVYAGKGDMTTRCNATIQAGDVDFMNYITSRAAGWFRSREIRGRFAHSVHDAFIWIIKDEDCAEFTRRIRETHKECYEILFNRFNIDFSSVPDNVWYPETVDQTQRWLKAQGDQTKEKSNTISFEGYEGMEDDDDGLTESSIEYD